MGLLLGNFEEGWGWRKYVSGLTSTQSYAITLSQSDSLSFSVGTQISEYSYKNFNANQFTISCKIQLYSTGDTMSILNWYGDSDNYISAYISSSNDVILKYKAGGTERSVSISPTIVAGNQYCAVFRADRNSYVDSSNYLRIDWGETSILTSGGTALAPGSMAVADATISVAQTWRNRGEDTLRGRLWMWILNSPLLTSEVTSFMSTSLSSEPIVNMSTKFMFAGTMSSSLPQGINYDSDSSDHSDTFEDGIGNYIAIDSTVSDNTTDPISDLHSMEVLATTGGGYSYRTFSVSSSTTYVFDIIVCGVSGQTVGILIEGNISGTLDYELMIANGTEQQISIQFTTGVSDTSIEVRFFDGLSSAAYYWNGEYMQVHNWESININWENLV